MRRHVFGVAYNKQTGGHLMIDFRTARQQLGLTQGQLALLLDTDAQSVRRIEMSPDKSTSRNPAPRMMRLIVAYLDGYRPTDWPGGGIELDPKYFEIACDCVQNAYEQADLFIDCPVGLREQKNIDI